MRTSLSSYPAWMQLALLALLFLVLIGLGYANYQFALQAPGGNDFLARWVGARYWLVEGVSPYAPEVSLAAQEMIYGRPANPSEGEDVAHFVYPFPSMLFFAPFALLSYPAARAIWMTLLEVGLPLLAVLGVRLTRWKPSPRLLMASMLFSVFWYHGLRAVVVGQFAVLEALLMVGALVAVQRKWDVAAGALLALSMSKPQMSFLLVPFVLLWALSKRRWPLILWTVVSGVVLVGASLLLEPSWPLDWLRQLLDYPNYTSLGSPVSIIAGVLPRGAELVSLTASGLFAVYLLWEWILALGKEDAWFQWTAAMTLSVTNLIAFRTATTNYVILLPALLLVFSIWIERWGQAGRAALGVALLGLLLGLWALFLFTVNGNVESAWMYLPLPILTFAGLVWARWWTIRGPRLPLEGAPG